MFFLLYRKSFNFSLLEKERYIFSSVKMWFSLENCVTYHILHVALLAPPIARSNGITATTRPGQIRGYIEINAQVRFAVSQVRFWSSKMD